MIDVPTHRFDALVDDALAAVPEQLLALLSNVALFVEDDAPADDPELLGYYDGVPLTERDSTYGGQMPDRIVVCRNPTLALCDTEADVVREVGVTVVHEIAHHFGIDDDQLHDWGWA